MTAGDVFLSLLDHFFLKCVNVMIISLQEQWGWEWGWSGVRRGHPPLLILLIFLHLSLKSLDTVQGGHGSVGLIWRGCGTGPGGYFSVICNNIDTHIVIVGDIVHVTVLSQ